eukprot:5060145-Prymnesium_polylepis.1
MAPPQTVLAPETVAQMPLERAAPPDQASAASAVIIVFRSCGAPPSTRPRHARTRHSSSLRQYNNSQSTARGW